MKITYLDIIFEYIQRYGWDVLIGIIILGGVMYYWKWYKGQQEIRKSITYSGMTFTLRKKLAKRLGELDPSVGVVFTNNHYGKYFSEKELQDLWTTLEYIDANIAKRNFVIADEAKNKLLARIKKMYTSQIERGEFGEK